MVGFLLEHRNVVVADAMIWASGTPFAVLRRKASNVLL